MDDLAILLHETELIKKSSVGKDPQVPREKLRSVELHLLTSSLARLLNGGIPILRALQALGSASDKPKLQKFIKRIQETIRQGSSFSAALEQTPGVVPSYFVQLVHAGEISGTMSIVLKELSRYLEKEENLKRKVREALTYPGVILFTGVVTLVVLMQFVIPKLAGVYRDFGSELPLLTRAIISASKLSLPVFIFGVFFAGFLGVLFSKQKKLGSAFLYRLPVAGKLMKNFVLIQFSRLMGLLMASGVTVLEALDMTRRTFSDPFLKEDVLYLKGELTEGKGFAGALSKMKWMDSLSRMLVVSGEDSGRLPEAFNQIAEDTEAKIESEIQWMLKLLEPGLILGVGLVVGSIVIGTILPIFDISGLMK